jgi:hypothetical protein
MTRRHLGIVLTAIAALLLFATGAKMADTMRLKAEGGQADPVTFQHRAHAMDRGIQCVRCHHNMQQVGTPPCAQCHKPVKEGETRSAEKAYHDACIPCHSEPPSGTTPPTECAQCHKK